MSNNTTTENRTAEDRIGIDYAGVHRDEVVVGENPENSDMGNPKGYIWGTKIFILSVTKSGRRFMHKFTDLDDTPENEAKAEKLAARINEVGTIDPIHWVETYEVYGSPAWEMADRMRQMAHDANPATAGTVRDY